MSAEKTGMTGFIQELRNRRVFRVATVYLGTGFVMLEAVDMIFPRLGLPDWTINLVMVLLAIGFPVAVGLAWSFQFTPDGFRRSPSSGEKQSPDQKPFTGNSIIIGLLVLILIVLVYPRFTGGVSSTEQVSAALELDAKAVAVLPFSNFSTSEEDAFFADGIHDDILTQLSKIRDLKVISRTTMIRYKDTELGMSDIAKELGVANILEGSVRRAGDQVRIVAQLIKADTDEHLWAETYDRKYADIFAIQTDVARKIAIALKSTLSQEEQQQLAEVPTNNMEAYDYYLKGNQFWYTKTTEEGNRKAAAMYERALELDPMFGIAWARISIVHSVLYQDEDWDRTPERKELARTSMQRAVTLIPENAETHFAKGIYHIWCEGDHQAALKDFEAAFAANPTHAEVAKHLAEIYTDYGDWDRARYYYSKSYELDPDAMVSLSWWAGMNLVDWNFDQAQELYRRALLLSPEDGGSYVWYSRSIARGSGEISAALKVIDEGIVNAGNQARLIYERFKYQFVQGRYEEALETINSHPNALDRSYYNCWVYWKSGDLANFDVYRDSVLAELRALNERVPGTSRYYARTAMIKAMMGNKTEALEAAEQHLKLVMRPNNSLFGPEGYLVRAWVQTIVGEEEAAVEALLPLISPPSIMTPWRIKYDPFLQELQTHPRLREILPEGSIS